VVFLAVVAVLCSLGLGLWFRAMLHSTVRENCQQAEFKPLGPDLGGAEAGPPPTRDPVTVELDEALFTEELEAYADEAAKAHGLDPEQLPSAREMIMQMARSNLLPEGDELDLKAVLEAHLTHVAEQVQATEDWSFEQSGANGNGNGVGLPPGAVPGGAPPGGAVPGGAPTGAVPQGPPPGGAP
jgi:hypothetical protein